MMDLTSEGTEDTVQQLWIKEEDSHGDFESDQTRWPLGDQARLARELGVPTSQRTARPSRTLCSADSYLLARERCMDAWNASNLERDDEVKRPIRKKRWAPHIVISDDEEPTTKRQMGSWALDPEFDLPPAPRTPPPMSPRASDRRSLPASSWSPLPSARRQGDRVLERMILKQLLEIQEEMEELKRGQRRNSEMLAMVLDKFQHQQVQHQQVQHQQAQEHRAQEHQMPADLGLPLLTVQDVDELEAKLNLPLRDSLARGLASIGGTRVQDLVRRIMQKLMTDRCARNYNWKGNNPPKFPFRRLRLCSVVINAVKRNPGTSSVADADIEALIKDWLRFAPEREGGRQRRQERKTREAAQEMFGGSVS